MTAHATLHNQYQDQYTPVPRIETKDTGTLKPNSRIYFKPSDSSNSISTLRGRATRGIKKAGWLEWIFRKATKLTFDQGRTFTWVNTKSLKKFIYETSPHYNYYQTFTALGSSQEPVSILSPNSSADIKKAHNASFRAFKNNAMTTRRGANSTDTELAMEVKLGEYLSEYVCGIYRFHNERDQSEQSAELKDEQIRSLAAVSYTSKHNTADNREVASKKVYHNHKEWAALHKFISTTVAFSKKETERIDSPARFNHTRNEVLVSQDRESQARLSRVDSAIRRTIGETATGTLYGTAAFAITAAAFTLPVAVGGAALCGVYKGYRTFVNPD